MPRPSKIANDTPTLPSPARGAHLCTHLLGGCVILTHPLIGPYDRSVWCDPLHADRYMLRRGSAWDGFGVGQFGDARLEKGGCVSAAHGRAIDRPAAAIGLP